MRSSDRSSPGPDGGHRSPWGAVANPQRKQPLLALRRRQAGVKCTAVRPTLGVHVAEHQGVALHPSMADPEPGKVGLTAFEFIVQVYQHGDLALPTLRHGGGVATKTGLPEVVVR